MAHVACVEAVAAGMRSMPQVATSFAATQAAWRFYANDRVTLHGLAQPLIDCARFQVQNACERFTLVAMDWSGLHFSSHKSRSDRVTLYQVTDLGYELFTALAISDTDGRPLAPLVLELKAKAGVYSTRSSAMLTVSSHLDNLPSVMAHVCDLNLGKEPVFIIDREADSVGHFRAFIADKRTFLVRANASPQVYLSDQKLTLGQVADVVSQKKRSWKRAGEVAFKGKWAQQHVACTHVTITRPARMHRYSGKGRKRKKRHKNIAGPPIVLRLIVSEIRDDQGKVLARWLLLTNLPEAVAPATVALWYYWRWRIESYHKLIKSAGLHMEHWQQETADTFSRRLLVGAMAVALVWQLAGSKQPAASAMREILVRLSGRQIKRGRNLPTFTVPALLAGLGVLLPMLSLLEQHSVDDLRALLRESFTPDPPLEHSG